MKHLYLVVAYAFITGCSASSEAPRTQLPVRADDSALTAFTNDVGWEITIRSARAGVTGLMFTTEGEAHTLAMWERATDVLIPNAWAHPGHLAGGEVIGELTGTHLVDFASTEPLGTATLIVAPYDGANFTFAPSRDLAGASLALTGTATRDDATVDWSAAIAQDDTRTVVGLPMDVDLTQSGFTALAFQFVPVDPTDATNTAFDGIDFGDEPELAIATESEGGIRLRRATQRHDFWRIIGL